MKFKYLIAIISILIFLAQMLQWPGANDYQMPEREFVEWRV